MFGIVADCSGSRAEQADGQTGSIGLLLPVCLPANLPASPHSPPHPNPIESAA